MLIRNSPGNWSSLDFANPGVANSVGLPQSTQRNQGFFSMISVVSVAKIDLAHSFSHSG
jgi:hypothetical protein